MSTRELAQGLPDLAGQPSWVYVVVIALTTAGSIGLALIKRGDRERKPEEPPAARPVDAQTVPSIPGTSHPDATLAIQGALEHLARVAEREASESKEARAETAELRRELVACGIELAAAMRRAEVAEADLSRARAHAELLGRQAFRKDGERDHG